MPVCEQWQPAESTIVEPWVAYFIPPRRGYRRYLNYSKSKIMTDPDIKLD
jgi:hypothetical protein